MRGLNICMVSDNNYTEPPVSGGSSTSSWLLLLVAVVAVAAGLVLYLKPEARERVFRVVQVTRADTCRQHVTRVPCCRARAPGCPCGWAAAVARTRRCWCRTAG